MKIKLKQLIESIEEQTGKKVSFQDKIILKEAPIDELKKYGIKELRDGLTLGIVKTKFPWILKANIQDAVLGFTNQTGLIWYNGTWKYGVWKYGAWKGGTFESGTWQDGIFHNGTWEYGEWKDGIWKNGDWEDGNWFNGVWYSGTWKDGHWYNGTWEKGDWQGGEWHNGTWKNKYSQKPA